MSTQPIAPAGSKYILVPDNAYGKPLSGVAIPEGYEMIGGTAEESFREPKTGEHYADCFECVAVWLRETSNYLPVGHDKRRIILRKKTKRYLVGKYEIVPDGLAWQLGKLSQGTVNQVLHLPHFSIVEE